MSFFNYNTTEFLFSSSEYHIVSFHQTFLQEIGLTEKFRFSLHFCIWYWNSPWLPSLCDCLTPSEKVNQVMSYCQSVGTWESYVVEIFGWTKLSQVKAHVVDFVMFNNRISRCSEIVNPFYHQILVQAVALWITEAFRGKRFEFVETHQLCTTPGFGSGKHLSKALVDQLIKKLSASLVTIRRHSALLWIKSDSPLM